MKSDETPYFYTFCKETRGTGLETHFLLSVGTVFFYWGSEWIVTEIRGNDVFCELNNINND